MNNYVVIIFVLFCSYHKSSAQEIEKCECDILQLNESGVLTNFTKQSGEINGRPFYFSIKFDQEDEVRTIVWWNVIESSWMFQINFKGLEYWKTLVKVENNINCPNFSKNWTKHSQEFKSRCLTDKNKCQGKFSEKSVLCLLFSL